MAWLQKVILALVVIFLILVALIFSLNNQETVSLNFLFFQTASYGVAFWLILAFVAGAVIGIMVTTVATLKVSAERRQLRRKLSQAEKSLNKASSEPARTH
ncbi:hypothetical protein CF392_04495 [Tamilnaduibacter salinus]|uniref:Lipopolysaccharide assembly protein A domain-containing protein n=1 Tax=Tamilnaduibacter salinus TaxID=1484056 RepID=A0A2A2I5J1_9GAMM|nr:LapA family protein [Tamilnaduibacter salinus]PAV26668.1 hypothetical protein CF392_04495 [Tamilnaduibacter salinus]